MLPANNSHMRLDRQATYGYKEDMEKHEDVETARDYLNANKGQWPTIAKATGWPYFSLQKFADGRIKEPGYSKLKALQAYQASFS